MIRIVKRPEPTRRQYLLMQTSVLLCALAASGLIMYLLAGHNPLTVYQKMVEGAFGSPYRIRATMNKVIPLGFISMGVAVAYKMKFWNIGAEGQMYMGGFGAAFVAFKFSNLPSYLMLPAMFIVGMTCAALWGLIPAVLKLKLDTSETLVTLMLNFIALRWISYLRCGPWRESTGFPKMPRFVEAAWLPSVFGVHIGWILMLVVAVFVYILLTRTKLGYQIAVIGESPATARYAAIPVARVTLLAMLISSAICGMAGVVQCSGVERTLNEEFTGGLGFTAVITAWLGRLSPPIILMVCLLFGTMLQGGSYIETALRIPSHLASVLQSTLIFFVLGSEFFIRYRVVFDRSRKEAR